MVTELRLYVKIAERVNEKYLTPVPNFIIFTFYCIMYYVLELTTKEETYIVIPEKKHV
jgi:hypothetical protein